MGELVRRLRTPTQAAASGLELGSELLHSGVAYLTSPDQEASQLLGADLPLLGDVPLRVSDHAGGHGVHGGAEGLARQP